MSRIPPLRDRPRRERPRASVLVPWLALTACAQPAQPSASESDSGSSGASIRVDVLPLAPTLFRDQVEATGSLEADNDAVLSARSAGTLQMLAPLGARVKTGEVVARIDPALPRTGLNQAEAARAAAAASLALAEQNYRRQKPLFDEGVISALEFQNIQAQYQQAKAELARAEAAVAQAQEALENTRILAPFAGVVDDHFTDRGEQVSPGTPVLRVLDASTLSVRAGLPERYAADIEVGTSVEVGLPAYGLEPRAGTVRFVATAIDPKSRTFDVEVALDNTNGKLKPEMVAKLFVTRARLEDVLVVPQEAVMRDEEGQHVFVVVDQAGVPTARRRSVAASGRAGGKVVVDGLSRGDRVVVAGQTKLIDGDRVEIGDGSGGLPAAASNGKPKAPPGSATAGRGGYE